MIFAIYQMNSLTPLNQYLEWRLKPVSIPSPSIGCIGHLSQSKCIWASPLQMVERSEGQWHPCAFSRTHAIFFGIPNFSVKGESQFIVWYFKINDLSLHWIWHSIISLDYSFFIGIFLHIFFIYKQLII